MVIIQTDILIRPFDKLLNTKLVVIVFDLIFLKILDIARVKLIVEPQAGLYKNLIIRNFDRVVLFKVHILKYTQLDDSDEQTG